MLKNIGKIIEELPLERRQYVEMRAKELIDEYMTRQDLRISRNLNRESLVQISGIDPDSVCE